jgi:hypothetical protein
MRLRTRSSYILSKSQFKVWGVSRARNAITLYIRMTIPPQDGMQKYEFFRSCCSRLETSPSGQYI